MIRKHILKYILFVVACVFYGTLHSQTTLVTQDLELRSSISLAKKLNKKLEVSFEEEFRFAHNMSSLDLYHSDIGVQYKILDNLTANIGYRFNKNQNSENIFQNEHRFSTSLKYKVEINRFDLSYRLQFQSENDKLLNKEANSSINNLRNKISLNYNIKGCKIDPFIQTEIFREYQYDEDPFFNKWRLNIGTKYSINKSSQLKLSYKIDNELKVNYPKKTYILEIGYKFSF